MTRTIKLIIEYDGTDFSGWQRQENSASVQGCLEDAVASMVGEPTPVLGASRTDAGVHAAGQVAHFLTLRDIPAHGFRRGLNSLLPDAIAVASATDAPAGFHARFSARGKHYRYSVAVRADKSPLLSRRVWMRPRPLEVGEMENAAQALVGEHDFSAFRAAGCQAHSAVREITAIQIFRERAASWPHAPTLVHIDVFGTGFLRNMVRIIAGTLVEVGEGRRKASDVSAALAARDRAGAGITAPARGLTLLEVFY